MADYVDSYESVDAAKRRFGSTEFGWGQIAELVNGKLVVVATYRGDIRMWISPASASINAETSQNERIETHEDAENW
jgi:hypothetical protein